jgi:hypothetical protein
MKRMMTLLLIGAALAACGKHDPVSEDATAPPENLAGDEAATGIAAPANSAAAEAIGQAAAPAPTDGMAWRYDNGQRLASYGPVNGPAMSPQLTFQCQSTIAGGPGGVVVTRADSPSAGKGTLSFTGNGHVASLEMTAKRLGTHGAVWQGVARGDVRRAIARTFAGPGPVEATIGAAGDLKLDADPAPRAALACAG